MDCIITNQPFKAFAFHGKVKWFEIEFTKKNKKESENMANP